MTSIRQSLQPEPRMGAGAWFDVRRGQSHDDPLPCLAAHTVILLGESHDDAQHHRWQRDTVAALIARREDLFLGFEMFPRRVQPVLDRWSQGALEESAFLHEVDWPRIWGFDPQLYMPLFDLARVHQLPMLALNVDRETNCRVAAMGFANVPLAERENVGEPTPISPVYRKRLEAWFHRHTAMAGAVDVAAARFERFVRAQSFWDRAMAEAIAGTLQRKERPRVVGIMGMGHVEYGDGVPHQLAALGIDDIATAIPWPANTAYPVSDPPIADFLFSITC